MASEIKVGVIANDRGLGGTYQRNVWILSLAYGEARKILTDAQYAYVADQVRSLATEADPARSQLCSVDAIEDFHELREKHGVLGKINLRVFFCLDYGKRAIVILGAIKKENNGPTPGGTVITMRRRKGLYTAGKWSLPTAGHNRK